MLDVFTDPEPQGILWLLTLGILGVILVSLLQFARPALSSRLQSVAAPPLMVGYQKILAPYQDWLLIVLLLFGIELWALQLPKSFWSTLLEVANSLALIAMGGWLVSRFLKRFFETYLLEIALKSGRKANSDLLILVKFLANLAIAILGIVVFAQLHQVNIVGLIASLGIGGLAVAFAAQKTLEQLLGGIVIYLDRPFVVDDYIGLPDGVFGRVESIGLRSTKIRTSGKGTLVIVPNSALTQVTVENYTGAKKVMALVYLNFQALILSEEQAFIRQIILESTRDTFGIDSQNTDIVFQDLETPGSQQYTQVQITFFILGSGEVSMELRRQLLDIASQNITQKLKDYRVAFEIEAPTIYVNSPITI